MTTIKRLTLYPFLPIFSGKRFLSIPSLLSILYFLATTVFISSGKLESCFRESYHIVKFQQLFSILLSIPLRSETSS